MDPLHRRMFVVGGYPGAMGDLWMLDLLESPPGWHRLAGTSTGPGDRVAPALAYDSSRDRLLLMGGSNESGSLSFSDVWEFSLATPTGWQLLPVAGARPSERGWHAALYDSLRDRLIIVGGQTQVAYFDDVWALPLTGPAQWQQLATSGMSPGRRSKATVVHDPLPDRIVRFGGQESNSTFNDVWTLPLATGGEWSELIASGSLPGPRAGAAGAFDIARSSLTIYGGIQFAPGGLGIGETYTLELSGSPLWRKEAAPSVPGGGRFATAILDSALDRILLFGGYDQNWLADVWAWDLAGRSWSEVPTVGTPEYPDPRADHAVALRASSGQMFMTGGYGDNSGAGVNEVWRMDFSPAPTWTRLPNGSFPGRGGHVSVVDEAGARLIVFGGRSNPSTSSDSWASSLDTPGAWTQIIPPGALPPPEEERGGAYDPVRGRLIVTGYRATGGWDVWALPLDGVSSWIDLTSAAPAPVIPIWGNSTVYDSPADQIVLLGGDPGSQVWALGLAGIPSWRRLYAGPGPSVRGEHAIALDTRRRRILLVGGYGAGGVYLPDAWEFNLNGTPGWRLLSPLASSPLPRGFHSIAYDFENDRLVLFAGHNGKFLGDTWYLQFDQPTAVVASVGLTEVGANHARIVWHIVDGASRSYAIERRDPASSWRVTSRRAPDGTGTIDHYDSELSAQTEYVYRLTWSESGAAVHGGEVSILTTRASDFEILGVNPTPAVTGGSVEFMTPDALPVRMRVFDVRGRRMWEDQLDDLVAGTHRVPLPTGELSPGIYYLLIEHAGFRKTARFAVLR